MIFRLRGPCRRGYNRKRERGDEGLEIERKWLVTGWPQGLPQTARFTMRQGYITVRPTVRIRSEQPDGQPAAYVLCFKSAGGQRDRNRRLNEICFRSGLSGKSALINEAVVLYVTLFAGVMLSAAVSAICVTALNEALGRYFVIRVDFKFAALTLFAATAVYLSVATISAAGSFNKKLRRNNYEQNGESYG